MSGKIYLDSYNFDDNANCYCGSGLKLPACCGDTGPDRKTPAGIFVVNNFLSPAECNSFLRFANKREKQWLTINDPEKSTNNKLVVRRDPGRVTQKVDISKKFDQVHSWIRRAVNEHIEPRMNQKAQWFEETSLLRYGPGGKYTAHSDSDHFDPEARRYFRSIDRDYSVLIYLNDNYEGGGLHFIGQDYTYQPKAGDMAFFPSNYLYTHESLPIIKGQKYALVSWGAFHGTPRLTPQPGFKVIAV